MQVSSSLLTHVPVMLSANRQSSLPHHKCRSQDRSSQCDPIHNKRRSHHLTWHLVDILCMNARLLSHHHPYDIGGDAHQAIQLGVRVIWRRAACEACSSPSQDTELCSCLASYCNWLCPLTKAGFRRLRRHPCAHGSCLYCGFRYE